MTIHTTRLISCIVPVFNGEKFLAQAIESIIAQKGLDLEILVVDDGSTDRSAEIAASFPQVTVIRQKNAGVAAARNTGLAHCSSGGYVAFLDADDLWEKGKLTAQLKALDRSPEAGYCLTHVCHVGLDGKPSDKIDPAPKLGQLMQCILARRPVFDIVGGFDTGTRTRADLDWFLRAKEYGIGSVVVPEVLVYRRIHDTNISLRHQDSVAEDLLTIARRAIDRRRRGEAQQTWIAV